MNTRNNLSSRQFLTGYFSLVISDIADVELPVFDEEDTEETTGTEDSGMKDKQSTLPTPKGRSNSSSSWPPDEKDAGAILDDQPLEDGGKAGQGEGMSRQEKCLRLMQELEQNRSEVNNNIKNIRARPNVRRQTSLSSLPEPKSVKSHPLLVKSQSCPLTKVETRTREVGNATNGGRTAPVIKDNEMGSGGRSASDDHRQDGVCKGSQMSHSVKPILKTKKPKTHRMDIENGISHITQDVIPEEDVEVFIPPSQSPASQQTGSTFSLPRLSSLPSPPMSPTSATHSKKPSSPPPPPPKPKTRPAINGHHLPRSPPLTANSDLKVGVIAPPAGFDSSPEEAKQKEQRRLKEAGGRDGGRSLKNGGEAKQEEEEEMPRVSVAERVEAAERMEALSSNMSNNNVDLDGEALEELLKGIDSQGRPT